jgi:hypothetical protein
MKFSLTVEMDNAAFGDCDQEAAEELARILRKVANRIESNPIEPGAIMDINGNKVGEAGVMD